MLIGVHKTVAELMEIFVEKINGTKMEIRKKEDEHNELASQMVKYPPQRGTTDDRPNKRLALQKEVDDLRNDLDWYEKKLEEAEAAVSKDPDVKDHKTYLELADMIRLDIEKDEVKEEQE